jgi:hypothetical protein
VQGGEPLGWADPIGKIIGNDGLEFNEARLTAILHPRMADVQHGWWFPERKEAEPELFGVFESNANVLCPDGPEFCSPEIGGWPHTGLLCRIEKL